MKNKVTAIAALGAKSRALGKNNDLIWKIPGDLPRFKKITNGHPVIMGFKTYESLPGLLKGRTNIVMTHDKNCVIDGATVVHSPEEALDAAKQSQGSEEIFIIGGGMIYTVMLPYTDELNLTLIDEENNTDADVFFPEYFEFTKVLSEEKHGSEGLSYKNVLLTRPETYKA